jgi:hypothetical protein
MSVSRRPPHGYAVSSLFAGPFDGWSRQSMAAARCYMIRSWWVGPLALAMTLAGAGFVPCEVPYPARVLTAYPCVVRRDPTVRGTFPSESKSETVSPGGSEKRGGSDARALLCSSHTVGQQTRLPVSAHVTCDVGGAAGLCTCHEGRGPGLRNLVRHEAGPCVESWRVLTSSQLRSNHVTTSGGHTLATPTTEGPGEKRTHGRCIGRPHASPPQPRPLC